MRSDIGARVRELVSKADRSAKLRRGSPTNWRSPTSSGTIESMRTRRSVGVGMAVVLISTLSLATDAGCIGEPEGSGAPNGAGATKDAGGRDVATSSDAGGSLDATTDTSTLDASTRDANPPVDAGAPWKLYSNATGNSPNVWNTVALDIAWSGPNAPPPRGIKAVTQLNDFPRLLVWADDGMFYVRDAAGWRTPQSTATTFPALAGRDFRGCYHQPPNPGTPPANRVEELIFVDNPTAILYNYTALDGIQFVSTVTLTDEGGAYGAPKASKKARWVLRSWDPSKFGTAAYLAEYSGYDNDPNVFFFDATPAPTNKWAFASAPLFQGKTNVPPQQDIMSGWRDDALWINYLVVR